jgi:hypothetical protein
MEDRPIGGLPTPTTLDSGRLRSFTEGFSGSVLQPADPGYEDARSIQKGLIGRRPALIAQCATSADIAAAVRLEHLAARRWVHYLGDDQGAATGAAYGPNFDRLRDVKRRYDPGNVLHRNHNIVP